MTFGIGAAGTGGHVFPALAVAEELVRRGVDRDEVVFFGGDRLEARAVPAAGHPFVRLELRGLRRGPSAGNLILPVTVWRAARRVGEEARARGIRVLLGMGGYATGPVAVAAWRRRIPLVLHEQNAVPGLANRLAARWASRLLVALPAAGERLPGAEVVGNPLRAELAAFHRERLREEARRRYGLRDEVPVLGILGGSLGAAALNRAVRSLVRAGGEFQVLHLTGREEAEEILREAEGAPLAWRVVPFEDSMQHFYAASDLVVCRGGASTVAELAATATPAVIVPPAQLARLGQEANARHLVEAGAAELIPEERLGELPGLVAELLVDGERLEAMAKAGAELARPDAAARVADVLMELAGA